VDCNYYCCLSTSRYGIALQYLVGRRRLANERPGMPATKLTRLTAYYLFQGRAHERSPPPPHSHQSYEHLFCKWAPWRRGMVGAARRCAIHFMTRWTRPNSIPAKFSRIRWCQLVRCDANISPRCRHVTAREAETGRPDDIPPGLRFG